MAANASKIDRFEELVQHQLSTIAARLEELGRRLEEERPFAPQKPEEVPGYAELKTALHNLIEHLELAEGRTAEAIGSLREQLEEVSRRTAEALKMAESGGAPVEAVLTLEERINALHKRLEEISTAAESNTRAYVDACMEELAAKVEQAATTPVMPENVENMIRQEAGAQVRAAEERIAAMVARLQGKIEDLASGAMDVERLRTDIGQIGEQLNTVRAELDEKAGRDELEQVRASLQQLSTTVENKADRADVLALKERLDALTAQLQAAHASGAPADDVRVAAIEEQVMALREMVEEALGEPLAVIGDKLAAHEASLAEVSAQTQRLQQMEEIIAQLQDALESGAAGKTAGGDMTEVEALKEGLKELEHFAREADRNAREMLEATQATLAEIVERLIALEEAESKTAEGPASTPTATAAAPAATSRREEAATMSSAHAHEREDAERLAAVADLLGESAPAAASDDQDTEAAARATPEASMADDHDPQDIARRIAEQLHRGKSDTTEDSPAAFASPQAHAEAVAAPPTHDAPAAQEPERPVHLEDDFIVAARRAALAAKQESKTPGQEKSGGGLLSRIMGGAKDKRATEKKKAREEESLFSSIMGESEPVKLSNDAEMMAPGANASMQLEGEPAPSGRKSSPVLNLLSGLREKLGKTDAPGDEAPVLAGAGAKAAGEGGQSRKRLLLAGVVLLAATSFYITQNQFSVSVPVAETSASDAETAQPGEREARPGDKMRAEEGAPGKVKEPTAKQSDSGQTEKNAPAKDRQAALMNGSAGQGSATSAGMFTPSTTASVTGAQGKDIITSSITSVAGAMAQQASISLPEEVGTPALRQAALSGDGKAAFLVATRYMRGHGELARDPEKAAEWFRRAAEKGVTVAMFRLGAMHERGLGVPKDLSLAARWYERAAAAGNMHAMHNLGALFASGKLGKADFEKAAYWFRKAAEHGVRDSQFNLAVLYHRGQGVPQDMEEAWFWYSAAAARGDSMAAAQAKKLGEYLGEEKLATLRKRLKEYRLKPAVRNANVVIIDRPEWRDAAEAQAASRAPEKELKGKALVMEVQKLLKQIGYDVGTVDGIMGNRTANAIRLFQLQSRMEVNGRPDMELLKRLRAAATTHS